LSFGKTISATILKTLAVIVVVVCYSLSMFVQLFPIRAAKFYESIGADKVAVSGYEIQYKKTGELKDLYNLILKSISVQDNNRIVEYIEIMINEDDYQDFCDNINQASITVAKLDRVAFVADLDSYLKSQLIKAYYYTDKSKAKTFAVEDLCQTENIYSVGLSTYIASVMEDKSLTNKVKDSKITQLSQLEQSGRSILEWVDSRLELVDTTIVTPSSSVDEILMVYTSLKLNQIKYNIYKSTNEQGLANNVLAEINRLQEVYESLVG